MSRSKPTVDEAVSILQSGRSLFTPEELRGEIRVSRATMYRLLSEGTIRSIRIGKAIRIPRSVVEGLVAGELPGVVG